MTAPEWDGLVVFCGGTPWDGVRGTDRHIAERLAAHVPVLFVDPPASLLARNGKARLERLAPGLSRLRTYVLPGQGRPLLRLTVHSLVRRAIEQAVRRLGAERVQAIVVANHWNLLGATAAERRVMYATDDFVAGAPLMRMDPNHLARLERGQAAAADTVIVTSPGLVDKWRTLGHEPVLIPNGCDPAAYADLELAATGRVAIFSGHISSRIDLGLLEAVADRGISLLLVGPRATSFEPERMERLLARSTVEAAGAQRFEALPSFLQRAAVGLTPYADNEFNRSSFPLKTLEYLAAGLPAVATDLPATRWLDTDLVRIASEPEAYADAVEAALAEPRTPDVVAARRSFAAGHSWDHRAAEVLAAIGWRELVTA